MIFCLGQMGNKRRWGGYRENSGKCKREPVIIPIIRQGNQIS